MDTIVTNSDDESYRNEEANWEFDSHTEDDVRRTKSLTKPLKKDWMRLCLPA